MVGFKDMGCHPESFSVSFAHAGKAGINPCVLKIAVGGTTGLCATAIWPVKKGVVFFMLGWE